MPDQPEPTWSDPLDEETWDFVVAELSRPPRVVPGLVDLLRDLPAEEG